jgi:hypothetical protein
MGERLEWDEKLRLIFHDQKYGQDIMLASVMRVEWGPRFAMVPDLAEFVRSLASLGCVFNRSKSDCTCVCCRAKALIVRYDGKPAKKLSEREIRLYRIALDDHAACDLLHNQPGPCDCSQCQKIRKILAEAGVSEEPDSPPPGSA